MGFQVTFESPNAFAQSNVNRQRVSGVWSSNRKMQRASSVCMQGMTSSGASNERRARGGAWVYTTSLKYSTLEWLWSDLVSQQSHFIGDPLPEHRKPVQPAKQRPGQMALARLFWVRCSLSKVAACTPLNSALQQSSLEATTLHATVWVTSSSVDCAPSFGLKTKLRTKCQENLKSPNISQEPFIYCSISEDLRKETKCIHFTSSSNSSFNCNINVVQ